jgi:asparagine synthase (glutamine-hydrolysing)
MCGLAGYWQTPGATESTLCAQVTRMMDTLTHRGPDDSGAWVDPAAGIALGFRRLAILDLSPTGHQPMFSADGRYVVIFNGEIYNYRDLRAGLGSAGSGSGSSDTEVILESCSIRGPEATIPRLWGMFATRAVGPAEHRLILARDRVGKSRCTTQMNDVHIFGSGSRPCALIRRFRRRLTAMRSPCICASATFRRRARSTRVSTNSRRGIMP